MFENRINAFENVHTLDHGGSENIYARQYNVALSQFRSALLKGKVFRLKRKALRRQPYLYDLNALKADLRVLGSSYSGIQVVPVNSIIGSEGRTADFDLHFHPLSEAARDRWTNMAIVHLSRIPLPPIQLIRIGDAYFVRDGHHRVSVARAFGQAAMDAEVITWNASPPFPWQPGAVAENPSLLKTPGLSA
ncbi:MAG TPA: hypothetical protein VK897_05605 [Anaerolineales bacterium]|nr:hypothetical protein [Anaerolineales bacterium]